MADEQTKAPEQQKRTMRGPVKMLLIFIGEDDKYEHVPLYEAIVRRLRHREISGATVLRGIMGFGAQRRIYGIGTLGIGENRPVTISVVESEEKINGVLPEIEELVKEGLIIIVDAFVQKHATGLKQKA